MQKNVSKGLSLFLFLALAFAAFPAQRVAAVSNFVPQLVSTETYDTGLAANGAEIISIRGNRAVLTNAGDGSLDILDTTDLLNITQVQRITGLTGLNSAAIHPTADYFLTVTGVSAPAASPVYGTLNAYRLSTGALLATAQVGIQPDSVGISPDGMYAVIANEAEAPAQSDNGGPGSLSLVDLSSFDPDAVTPTLTVTPISLPSQNGVSGFSTGRTDDIGRIAIDNTPNTLEPETVTFSHDSQYAFVSLQENSGVVKVKLSDQSMTFFGLGETTHLADTSTTGGYQPITSITLFRESDGIALTADDMYFVTADEGDTRNSAGSGAIRGGRTVSIFNASTGAFVGDTGSQLDDIANTFGVYPDSRSNRGGSEPEVLDVATFNSKTIVAVGLERASSVALVDITTPASPTVFAVIPSGANPEGIKLVERDGNLYMISANEAAGTATIASVPVSGPAFSQDNAPTVSLHDLAVLDPDTAQTITVTITLDAAAGSLTGTGLTNPTPGTYTVSGTVASVNTTLASLEFTPASPDGNVTISISANDGIDTSETGVVTILDVTSPTITVNNPNTSPATSKTITASMSETGTLTMSNTTGSTCDNSLTFAAYASQMFSSESDNGIKVCYQAVDSAGNEAYQLSNAIAGIDTTSPTITVNNPNTSPATSKTITASMSETGTLTMSNTTSSTCDNSLTFVAYASQMFSSESDNGIKVCYQAVDSAGNQAYQLSNAIAGIDTTAPTITVNNPNTSPATSKTITASVNDGTLTMSNTTGSTCNNSLTFAAYASQTFSSESDNGIKVCYKAVDSAGNQAYQLSNAIAGIDTTAPDTTLTQKPVAVTLSTTASFQFTSDDPSATLACKLDSAAFTACASPRTFSGLAVGSHTFQVRATDAAGNVETTPAIYTWIIQKERIFNGGFNQYPTATAITPNGWRTTAFSSLDGKNTLNVYEGSAALQIVGKAGTIKSIEQPITVAGLAGSPISFSFQVKGKDIPTTGLCQAQVFLYNGVTQVGVKRIPCPTGTFAYQLKRVWFNAPATFNNMLVKFVYSKASGLVWFDLVSLLK